MILFCRKAGDDGLKICNNIKQKKIFQVTRTIERFFFGANKMKFKWWIKIWCHFKVSNSNPQQWKIFNANFSTADERKARIIKIAAELYSKMNFSARYK